MYMPMFKKQSKIRLKKLSVYKDIFMLNLYKDMHYDPFMHLKTRLG